MKGIYDYKYVTVGSSEKEQNAMIELLDEGWQIISSAAGAYIVHYVIRRQKILE